MPGLIAKQPNSLYCRISTVVEAPTHDNMTKEELEDLLITQRSLDINLVALDQWLAVYEVDFNVAIEQLGSACSNFEETKEWLIEVGYQHADEFMEKIAYRWDEWEEDEEEEECQMEMNLDRKAAEELGKHFVKGFRVGFGNIVIGNTQEEIDQMANMLKEEGE